MYHERRSRSSSPRERDHRFRPWRSCRPQARAVDGRDDAGASKIHLRLVELSLGLRQGRLRAQALHLQLLDFKFTALGHRGRG
jgi:hypothetical protein